MHTKYACVEYFFINMCFVLDKYKIYFFIMGKNLATFNNFF